MTWHADASLLDAYVAGALEDARAFSLEAHLLACARCRAACARTVDREPLDAAWTEIVDRIDRPKPRALERLMLLLGVPEHVARLVAATRSLQASWFLAVGAALAFAVLAAHTEARGLVAFLVTAPLIPLAGIAAAYGPGIDPTHEIGLAAPMRSFRLLLIRAVAVLVTSMGSVGVAALMLPRIDWTSAAWLLPSLSLAVCVLALATVVHPVTAATLLAGAWVMGVVTAERMVWGDLVAFRSTGQAVCAAVALVAAAVVVRRRDRFEVEHVG